MASGQAAIQTFKLTKEFNGLVAVNNLDLTIYQGELFSLLGPNGAGKTTTINMLCCLLKPSGGTASVLGFDILKSYFDIRARIGVSPQDIAISERLNSWENLRVIGRVHGLDAAKLQRRAQELLETVGLVDRARDSVNKFSGGMKRRLNLIMALVHDPEVIFLDEPTLGLDPQSRRAIWEYIADMKGKKTVLLTTHYMEEADFLSDRIGIIDEGRIVALGTSGELKRGMSVKQALVISASAVSDEILAGLKEKYGEVKQVRDQLKIFHQGLDLKEVVDHLSARGVTVYSAAVEQPTLEDVFLEITGKELRE